MAGAPKAESLRILAIEAAARCHAPYSKFPVGVALETTDGRRFTGANIEIASYPEGWCAETTAISHMVMDGGGKIAEVAVVGLAADLCTPCGGCRQRLAEFGGPETLIHLCNKDRLVETVTLGDLFPMGFSLETDGA